MSGKSNFLREWRRRKGYTQEQVIGHLAALDDPDIPQTAASLSRLENGKQPYGQRILEALAEIYDTSPDQLIGRDPTKDGRLIDFVARLDERQKAQAEAILEALLKAG